MRWYLGIAVMVAFSVLGMVILALNFDPFTATRMIKVLFFASLFLALWGLAALFFALPSIRQKTYQLFMPLRRGFFVSATVVGFVALVRLGRFTITTVIVILLTELATEFFIHRYERRNAQTAGR